MLFKGKLRLIDCISDHLWVSASCALDNSPPFFFKQLSAVFVRLLFLFHDHITLECLPVSAAQVLIALLDTKTLLCLVDNFVGLFIRCDLSAFIVKLFK